MRRTSLACVLLLAAASDAHGGPTAPFDVVEAIDGDLRYVTSITISPDGGHLYAATLSGELRRWTVDRATGALSAEQSVAPSEFSTPDGPRGLVGLAFDPEDPLLLWVTDNHPVPLSGKHPTTPDFSGRLLQVRVAPGTDFAVTVEPYLTGLPRSCADHLTNSIAFRANPGSAGPAHLLYLSQGSNSSMGALDQNWCMRPERLLNAAVLEIDPRREAPPAGFDVSTEPLPVDGEFRRFGYTRVLRSFIWPEHGGALKGDPIAIDAGPYRGAYLRFDDRGVATVRAGEAPDAAILRQYYDPFAQDAIARLFVTGLRNGYDLVWHSNGSLYVAANGSSAGAHAPDDPRTPADEDVTGMPRQPDLLYRFEGGEYGGHPNPLRDEYVAFGGNPTTQEDPFEQKRYQIGTQPDPRFPPDRVHSLGFHHSPTGTIEYPRGVGHAGLGGALIFATYSHGNLLWAFQFDEDGAVAQDFPLVDLKGEPITSPDPIDIAVDAAGRIYVATLPRSNGVGKLLRLDPARTQLGDARAEVEGSDAPESTMRP
jgi:hypothetical protein